MQPGNPYPPLRSCISQNDYGALCAASYVSDDAVDLITTKEAYSDLLERVMKVLCPWPCVRVKPDYWFTPDGSLVANCQWRLYENEAISRTQAANMLGVSGPAIYKMAKQGKLTAYRLPDHKLRYNQNGTARRPWYFRRSEVEALRR